jgi:hypothetical protein
MVERLQSKVSFGDLRAARRLFPPDREGHELLRSSLSIRTPSELLALRQEFAPGKTGDNAFVHVNWRPDCQVSLGNQDSECNRLASSTVDFDVSGHVDFVSVCREDGHAQLVMRQIAEDLRQTNPLKETVFGRNGFGRETDIPQTNSVKEIVLLKR